MNLYHGPRIFLLLRHTVVDSSPALDGKETSLEKFQNDLIIPLSLDICPLVTALSVSLCRR